METTHIPGTSMWENEGSLAAKRNQRKAYASLKSGRPPPAGRAKNGLTSTLWPAIPGVKRPTLPVHWPCTVASNDHSILPQYLGVWLDSDTNWLLEPED